MEKLESPFGLVELTVERENHIFEFHPEVRKYRKYFGKILADPQIIRRSKTDPATLILYKRIVTKKYLAVVIKIEPKRNFILTAYLTDKIKPRQL